MNRQFPALRGLAILLVIFNHTIALGMTIPESLGYPVTQEWVRFLLIALKQCGLFAVPTFLFLSGCFFVYAAKNKSSGLPWKVVWNGLKHLLWPYVFWSLVFYLVLFLFGIEKYSPIGYLKNLAVGYPYNFVPLLAFFYVLSPLLVRMSRRYAWVLLGVVALYQVFLLNLILPGYLGFQYPDWARYLGLPVIRLPFLLWGMFFPLGVVYSLNMERMQPALRRFWPVSLGVTVVFFLLAIMHETGVIYFPVSTLICPLAFVFLLPLIERSRIPRVKWLEMVGKRAYGLYLSHFVVLNVLIYGIAALAPGALNYQVLLMPILFFLGLNLPMVLMNAIEHMPKKGVYRFVFG